MCFEPNYKSKENQLEIKWSMRMSYGFVKHLSICIDREILFISDGEKHQGEEREERSKVGTGQSMSWKIGQGNYAGRKKKLRD